MNKDTFSQQKVVNITQAKFFKGPQKYKQENAIP